MMSHQVPAINFHPMDEIKVAQVLRRPINRPFHERANTCGDSGYDVRDEVFVSCAERLSKL
jgi:hypothetical protein